MSNKGYPKNERYTRFSESAKEKIEIFFNDLHSRDEVYDLIDEFISLPADGSGETERKIAGILSDCSRCGYAAAHGSKTVCADRTDKKAVAEAADEYRKFADSLPDEAGVDDVFYSKVLEIYKDYKSPSDYMTRLVKDRMRDISPELIKRGNRTRLLIFKQFLKAAEFPKTTCLSRELRDYICEKTKLPEKPSKNEVEKAIASLTDDVFKKLDEGPALLDTLRKELDEANKKYKNEKAVYDAAKKEFNKAKAELKDKCGSDIDEYIKAEESSDLIYKYIKAEEKLNKAKQDCAGLFKAENRLRDARKSDNETWKPLMWADELSKSSFSDQRTTRTKLYWFAIIFEMTYSGSFLDKENEKTDIQNKLFYEFYSDNLLNNLLESDASLEKEPTGHGINFKNFAEVVYLYYIHRNDLTPAQKLSRAKRMINKCKESNETVINRQVLNHGNKNTTFYEPLTKSLMDLPEDKVPEFISQNYICGKKGVNIIRVASENINAADIYKRMVDKLVKRAEMTVDHESVSYERIYSIMEAEYYMKNRCSKCGHAAKRKLYEKCAFYNTKCIDAYDEYLENFYKEHSGEPQEPKKRERFYLDKCANCQTAYNERFFEQCPLFESNCEDKYRNYREEKLDLLKERKKRTKIVNDIIKDQVMANIQAASALFDQVSEKFEDDSIKLLLNKISKKFRVSGSPKTVERCIKASFLPAGDVSAYVTRTKMVVLYYYIFMMRNINEYYEYNSFADFYNEFCANFELKLKVNYKSGEQVYHGLNDCLMSSGYQEINTKNIFDMFVLFFAFRHYGRIIKNIEDDKEDR